MIVVLRCVTCDELLQSTLCHHSYIITVVNNNTIHKYINNKYINNKYINNRYINNKYINNKYINNKYINNKYFNNNYKDKLLNILFVLVLPVELMYDCIFSLYSQLMAGKNTTLSRRSEIRDFKHI